MDREKKEFRRIPFEMRTFVFPDFPGKTVFAKDFLEKGESLYAIQRAVNACSEAGGGTVVIEAGEWLTAPVHLSNNIHLHLEKGANVRFCTDHVAYLPVVFTRWEGTECYNYSPLIYALNCKNIAITGKGRLIGGGEAWWHWKKLQQEAANELCYAESNGIPVEQRIYGTEEAALRPSFIQLVNCRNIQLKDFTIEDGPQWMLHPVYCEQVLVSGVTVLSEGPNTDGLNPDSCKNVIIENCHFRTGDDCIAINSGMNEDGWRVKKPCKNIVISHCTMSGGHGGIAIGSGISGGAENIYAYGCKISGTNQGIRLKSMRGRGGYVRNVWFEDIEINGALEEAVQINMFYPYSTVMPRQNTPSDFSDIHLKNIYGSGGKVDVEMKGLPEHPLRNITFEKVDFGKGSSFLCENALGVNFL